MASRPLAYPIQWAVQAPFRPGPGCASRSRPQTALRGRERQARRRQPACCASSCCASSRSSRRTGACAPCARARPASRSARWSPRSCASTSTRSASACSSTRARATACSAARPLLDAAGIFGQVIARRPDIGRDHPDHRPRARDTGAGEPHRRAHDRGRHRRLGTLSLPFLTAELGRQRRRPARELGPRRRLSAGLPGRQGHGGRRATPASRCSRSRRAARGLDRDREVLLVWFDSAVVEPDEAEAKPRARAAKRRDRRASRAGDTAASRRRTPTRRPPTAQAACAAAASAADRSRSRNSRHRGMPHDARHPQRFGWGRVIVLTILALAATVVPLPALLEPFRPDFVALTVLWSACCRRACSGSPTAGAPACARRLQGHAARPARARAPASSRTSPHKLQLQIRIFPLLQQSAVILLLLWLDEFLLFWIDGVAGHAVHRLAPLARRCSVGRLPAGRC